MRDRLIELIMKTPRLPIITKGRKQGKTYQTVGNIADNLLANGVVVPPCKVGDIVYRVDSLFKETTITELKVIELTIDSKGIKTLYGTTPEGSVHCFDRGHNLNDIKFTKEEAERALKGGEG